MGASVAISANRLAQRLKRDAFHRKILAVESCHQQFPDQPRPVTCRAAVAHGSPPPIPASGRVCLRWGVVGLAVAWQRNSAGPDRCARRPNGTSRFSRSFQMAPSFRASRFRWCAGLQPCAAPSPALKYTRHRARVVSRLLRSAIIKNEENEKGLPTKSTAPATIRFAWCYPVFWMGAASVVPNCGGGTIFPAPGGFRSNHACAIGSDTHFK